MESSSQLTASTRVEEEEDKTIEISKMSDEERKAYYDSVLRKCDATLKKGEEEKKKSEVLQSEMTQSINYT